MADVVNVDVSPFISASSSAEARAAAVEAWDAALSGLGFVRITGHGVDAAVVEALFDEASAFFASPLGAKLAHRLGESYGSGAYTPAGVEAVGRTEKGSEEAPPDLVENYVYFPTLTNKGPGRLHAAAQLYWDAMVQLVRVLHEVSARALSLEPQFFDAFYEPSPAFALRLAYYPPVRMEGTGTEAEAAEGQTCSAEAVRYGAHTDYQGFTVLRMDPRQPGLEIEVNGTWHQIDPDGSDALLINTGDLLQRWTNDRWTSTMHRVSNPPRGSAAERMARLSLVFFTGPRDDALIETLPSEVSEARPLRPEYAEPVVSGEHLRAKLEASNV